MQRITKLAITTLFTGLLGLANLSMAAETPAPAKSPQTKESTIAANQSATSAGKINLNTASSSELSLLKGIGSIKAEAIVRFREEHGPFTRIDDLTAVKGIGQATLEKNRMLVTVE
jgi:competence protein ComEA